MHASECLCTKGDGGEGRKEGRGREGGRGERERERERENLKTLFYKDCSLGSVKNISNN